MIITHKHTTLISPPTPSTKQHPQQYPTYFPIERTNEQDENRENRDGERDRERDMQEKLRNTKIENTLGRIRIKMWQHLLSDASVALCQQHARSKKQYKLQTTIQSKNT